MRKVSFLRAAYFVWIIVPMGLYAVYAAFGLPHVIWSYDWSPIGPDSYTDFSRRQYTRCTYAGPTVRLPIVLTMARAR
jgi:hypothetical protein